MHEHWQQVKSMFQRALERPPDARESFLNDACNDESLRDEVRNLLRSHDASPDFLQPPDQRSMDPLTGRHIGAFQIVRRIGTGGMGAVYEARQDHPERPAAIKVLRPGFATASVLRRFEFEAEILARLQHPGIAHVYAAGTFDLGDGPQPWFAMELIDGEPLNSYVQQHALSVQGRIELLLNICDAVQHAHQRGVVHRDLKPANIVVTRSARPKILDFGVARVTGADPQATMHTAAGDLVGTLNYMSPEQLTGDPDAIDARCDVYAIGVIGFEMLVGQLPHDRRSRTMTDLVRAIEWDEPTRLGAIEPGFRGDIETIFAKALERDRERRYQSAADLASDLRRYLNDEPILARPATALYQFRKYARRNRALVGGVAATMLALLIGLLLYAAEARHARIEADRAQYEADKATAINNFIANDFLMKLLAAANERDGEQRLPVADLVDQAAANVGVMFADDPLAEAAVRNEVGSIYYNLSAFEKAADQFRLSLERWEQLLGPNHVDTLKGVNNLGQCLAHLGTTDEAEALYRRALDGRTLALGEDDPYTLATMNNLSILLQATGRIDEAETMMRRTLAAQRRVHGDTHKHTLITMINLGTLLINRGDVEEAENVHRQVYQSCRDTLGEDHVTTLAAGIRLGSTLRLAGRLEEATDVLEAALARLDRAVGPAHRDTLVARHVLARVYTDRGHKDDAIAQLRIAIGASDALGRQARHAEIARRLKADLQQLLDTAPPPPSGGGASPQEQ